MVKEKLIEFESEIADLFNNKKIKSPIHLYYGDEDIDHAIETKDLLRPHLKELEENALQTVHDFVSFWKEKLK
jgi:hypothetical protein